LWILVELLTITLKYFFSYDQVKNILKVSYYKGRLKLQKISIYDERELRTLWVSPVEQDTWVHHCVCWVSVAQFVHAVFCVVFCGIVLVFLSYLIWVYAMSVLLRFTFHIVPDSYRLLVYLETRSLEVYNRDWFCHEILWNPLN
jgi:hypothetical protein